MKRPVGSILWITLSLALVAVVGCGDEDDVIAPPPPDLPPIADTPDELMANYQIAYSDMNIAAYRDAVLADTYEFILRDETVEEFEIPDGEFDLDEELAITEKMFSGQANAEGKVLTDIEIQVFQPDGTWQPVAPSDPHFGTVPGALSRMYSVLIYFNVQGDFRYKIHGSQVFYVVADTIMHQDTPTQCYRLRGQLDLSSILPKRAVENTTWSELKALYR